jgi:choline monooxygenase
MTATLAEKLARFDDTLPLERARSLPALWYTDPEIADLERRAVFGEGWQAVGRTDQVACPGQFFTADVAGEPVVVVRGEDGALRALANVCRHRAAAVVPEPEGTASRLRCRYHGWTYDLCGRLRGTPDFDGVTDFHKEENGLPAYTVDSWGPIVWAHLGSSPPPLLATLAPLPEQVAGLGLEQLRFAGRREYHLACNWKVFVDNYLDGGYHLPTVHPGLTSITDYKQYHTAFHGLTSIQTSRLRVPDATAQDIGRARPGDVAYYWWAFPNFMLNIYAGLMDTNLVLPTGPENCRVVFDFYFADTESPQSAAFIRDSIAVADQVQREDQAICEEVQRGLRSRSYDTGRFNPHREGAGYHFHQLLARRLRGALPPMSR